MGEITRRWPFESDGYARFELTIREPPITGDSLGLKTWGSSYLLAQNLHQFASDQLSHLVNDSSDSKSLAVLELGSGTGLLGLAAACIWRTSVVLHRSPQHHGELGAQCGNEPGGYPGAWRSSGSGSIDVRVARKTKATIAFASQAPSRQALPPHFTCCPDSSSELTSPGSLLWWQILCTMMITRLF